MSTVIRLTAVPITELPQLVKSEASRESMVKVNCLLHSDHLPAHQHLEVRVNGVSQQGMPEGDHQMVFSWQLQHASDEIRITLLKRGVVIKYWQGCWNERDAILSMGTLALQVFFDGKPQPIAPASGGLTAAITLEALHPSPEAVNGQGHHDVQSEPGNTLPAPDAQPDDREGIIVQDLLVLAEPQLSSTELQNDQEKTDDEVEDRVGGEAREELEAEDEPDDEAGEEREDELENEIEDEPDDEREGELGGEREDEPDDEIVGSEAARKEAVETQEDPQTVVQNATTVGMRIATFHANAQHSEETLDALKKLLATMPSKTVLIDLRQHSQTKKRRQEPGGLSKDRLRAVFGGTYWDRGWAIQTAYRSVPTSESPSGWRRVVIQPESHPDGILSLVRFLQEGYSMVVIDQMAAYAESPRRGVIEELHNRLPDLVVGPLG